MEAMAEAVAQKVIAELASKDMVEAVRCKDCKYGSSTVFRDNNIWLVICNNDHWMLEGARPIVEADWYCSHGEKRYETN